MSNLQSGEHAPRVFEILGNVINLFMVIISIINAWYKGRKGSIDDIQVADIMVQLVNAGEHVLYTAIIDNDVISWSFAAINFLFVCIYLVVYWKYSSSDQKKKILISVIVIAGLLTRIVGIPNIIPFLNKDTSREEVNAILYVVISILCSFYAPIRFLALINVYWLSNWGGSFTSGTGWYLLILVTNMMVTRSFPNGSRSGTWFYTVSQITNIVGISCGAIYMILWSIFVLYILCRTKGDDLERGETSEGTPHSSLLQTQPEPDTILQNIGTATGSANDLMPRTDRRTSYETQNESAPKMKHHNSASAPASSLSTLPHFPAKDEGDAPTSVDSTLSSNPNVESETPTNLQDQTLATPTGFVDPKSTTAAISSCASSETQNESEPNMKCHELHPSASALATPLPPLLHSPAKEEGAAPISVYSTLSSIPNLESETPTNLQDQILATPTGFADDCYSTTAVNSSRVSSETQNESAPDMNHHKLNPSNSALASPLSPSPYPPSKEEDAAPTLADPPLSSIPIVKSEIPTNLQDQTLATPTASADDRKSAAAVNSSLASSETQNQSAPDTKRPILDPLASTSSPLLHSTAKEETTASPSLLLPVSTVTERAPLVDGPRPYQGLYGPAEGGLLGAPPKYFTLTAP